jgi:hypothetical protein
MTRPIVDPSVRRDWQATMYLTRVEYFRVLRFVDARKEKLAIFARKAVLEKVEREAGA